MKSLAVWKFASCDGCQLSLLDCEDELLEIASVVRVAHFLEASSAVDPGPYDISLVEGSITAPEDAVRVKRIRQESKLLIAMGACATRGGIQALRNLRPDYLSTLDKVVPVSQVVPVDLELRGCPVDRRQLLHTLAAVLRDARPSLPTHSVCFECKARGTACLLVTGAAPCLGPVTQAGCGALCPAFGRGCFGCFGPTAQPNPAAMNQLLRASGLAERDIDRLRTAVGP